MTANPYMQTMHKHPLPAEQRPLDLYMEVLDVRVLAAYPELLNEICREIALAGVDELNIHGALNTACACLKVPGFEAAGTEDTQQADSFSQVFRTLKAQGVKLVLSGAEPTIPEGFFDHYPEARNVSNGLLYQYFESRIYTLFQIFPNVDTVQFHMFETGLLNDQDLFRQLFWAPDSGIPGPSLFTGYKQTCTTTDYIVEIMTAFSSGAKRAGKSFSFLTFCHYPYQERLVIDALKALDIRAQITLDHKCQPGDWDPFRPANNVMLQVTDRGPSKIKFDGVGEYWGQGLHPYCYPDEIQARLIAALEKNQSISSVGMRVHWMGTRTLFGKPDEINWFALRRLAKNPYTPIEDIWHEWALMRFGKAAADRVISALRRSQKIVNLSHYIRGAWAQQHSRMASLNYFMAQILMTGRAQMEWTPDNFIDNMLLRDLIFNPREHNINTVLEDRYEALRLVNLSIEDIEAARADLTDEAYTMLREQFSRLKVYVEMCIPHVEAGLRCMMQKVNPSPENRERIKAPLLSLSSLADRFESGELDAHPFIPVNILRDFIRDAEAFMLEN